MPLCPLRQLHLTFFCAPQWDTFFLVMDCPHVWHFLNSSIKQLSFTIVFDWCKSCSVFLSDFDFSVKLNSASWWKIFLRRSTEAALHILSLSSAKEGDWDEAELGATEAVCQIWILLISSSSSELIYNTNRHEFDNMYYLLTQKKGLWCHMLYLQKLAGMEKVIQYPQQQLEHPREKPEMMYLDPCIIGSAFELVKHINSCRQQVALWVWPNNVM